MSTTKPQITVLGLGTGDEDQLTLGVWKKLQLAAKEQAMLYPANERSSDGSDAGYERDSL